MKNIIFLFFLSLSVLTFSQNYTIKGTIEDFPDSKIYLADFYGDQNNIIDSTQTNESGEFEFIFSQNTPVGLYRLIFGNNNFIDLIFNKENIKFTTKNTLPNDNMKIINSIENILYYDYLFKRNLCQYKLDLLQPLINYYPKTDSFYLLVKTKYNSIQHEFNDYVNGLTQNNPNTFMSKFAAFDNPPLIDPELSPLEQKKFLQSHFLDNIDFTDTALLRSNVISTKIISYLSLYQNQRFTKEQLEDSFMQAVDTIMAKASVNTVIYEFVIDYLISGFEKFDFFRVITHIAENTEVDKLCVKTESISELENRIEILKNLAIGKQAPEIQTTDLPGNEINLYELDFDNILIIFWASWCPYCTKILSEIKQIYIEQDKKNLEIIAISIDTSKTELTNYLLKGDYNWINICDFVGWDSQPAKDYGIYATPTMLLLDRNKKIIAKPGSAYELKKEISD